MPGPRDPEPPPSSPTPRRTATVPVQWEVEDGRTADGAPKVRLGYAVADGLTSNNILIEPGVAKALGRALIEKAEAAMKLALTATEADLKALSDVLAPGAEMSAFRLPPNGRGRG